MIHLTDAEVQQESELEIGTKFWEIYQGYTATGRGQISKIWEITESLGNGLYSCKLTSDNTVFKINPAYREKFHVHDIKRIMKETPIIKRTGFLTWI